HLEAVRLYRLDGRAKAHLRDLVAPRGDAFDLVPRAAVDDLRQGPLLADRGRVERKLHRSSSGAISFGRMSGISGNRMIAASMSSIGTSMIAVSLMANLSGTFATAQEIIRHRPYGGVTSPKASETMPMMAKWMGCMPT